jgi:hypothetical protein
MGDSQVFSIPRWAAKDAAVVDLAEATCLFRARRADISAAGPEKHL